ncbi:hypothetical protein VTK26DRAFT_8025 [Humicola hyalothermophila]
MLNKKSAFKPKATVRRPPPGSASQNPSQRPLPAEPTSKTPAPAPTPAPQEPDPPSQPQPAPQPIASTAADAPSVVSNNGESQGVQIPAQESAQAKEAVVDSAPQGTAGSTATTTVSIGAESAASSTARPAPEPYTADQREKPASDHAPPIQKTVQDVRPAAVATPGAVTDPLRDPATSSERPIAQADASSTAPTPNTTPAAVLVTATSSSTPAFQDQPAQPTATATDSVSSEQPQPTTERTLESVPEATEATTPIQTRKRKTNATTGEASTEQQSTAAPPTKRSRKRAAPLPGEEGYEERRAASRTTRAQKRSRSRTADGETEAVSEGSTPRPRRRKPSRPHREATPEDAENVQIDVAQVKMADLAKDMRVGKKFSLHDELMERERVKRLRYNERRKRQQSGEVGDDTAGEGPGSANASPSDRNSGAQTNPGDGAANGAAAETARVTTIGEQYQIIDGEIVLDHRSLQVDRHARAREAAGELVEVEENDFTHHTTSATYLRRNLKPQQWSDEETELFYQALSAFGTDFDTICRMFKGKTRKHIKLKFNREERVNPSRINAALVGQKTVACMSMDEYQRRTGREYESAEAIYAEQRRAEEEFEARRKQLEDEKADEARRRKEEVLAQLNSSVEGENADEAGAGAGGGGGKKGRGRKKKAPSFVGL